MNACRAEGIRGDRSVPLISIALCANVKSVNKIGYTLLLGAGSRGHEDVAELIRKHGGKK